MKTKDIPAIVMLLAGGVYCLLGILYQIPLMDFLVQLLIVLLLFWIIGGIIRMILDKFMGEIEDKAKEEEEEAEEKDAEGESDESDETSKEEEKGSEEEK
ncbi:MAG: hypothetical protein IJ455_05380 [Agathobacter sp.]|nr:hypothetical protein [Agathobacter sp.]